MVTPHRVDYFKPPPVTTGTLTISDKKLRTVEIKRKASEHIYQ